MCYIIPVIFGFLLSSSVNAFAADIDVIVYADNNYAPYSYEEGVAVKGIYSEILKSAFSRIDGYKVKIKSVPWKRGCYIQGLSATLGFKDFIGSFEVKTFSGSIV